MRSYNLNYSRYQQGVVLFFALIALVVMSLAAAALIRSVDTTGLIAGNLAFRRGTVISSDHGVETSINWLNAQTAAILEVDDVVRAYYASVALPAAYAADPMAPTSEEFKAFVDGEGIPATGVGVDATGKDAAGNTITYVVQRMCNAVGEATPENCLLGPGEVLGCTDKAGVVLPPSACAGAMGPIYRVTARVVGPKDTLSYIQAFVN